MDHSAGVYDLARLYGVPISQACRRARIAHSTPSRWRLGSRPRPGQVEALRAAIIDLGRERGSAERVDAAVIELLRQVRALVDRAIALCESIGGRAHG